MKYKNNHIKRIAVVLISALLVFATALSGCSSSSQSVNGKTSLKGASSENVSDLNYVSLDEGFTNVIVKDEESAMDAVASVADILGIEDVEKELKVCDVNTVDGDSFYRFQQYYNDIPVYGKTVVVAADENNTATNLVSNTCMVEIEDTVPNLNVDDIEKAVKKYYDDEIDIYELTLENLSIYDNDSKMCLTYNFFVDTSKGMYEMFVDADNGKIIKSMCRKFTEKATGEAICWNSDKSSSFNGFYDGSKKEYQMYNNKLNYYMLSFEKTDSDNNNNKQTFITSEDSLFGNTKKESELETDKAVDYFNNIEKIRNYFLSVFASKADEILFCYYNDAFDSGNNGYATSGYSDGSVIDEGKKVGIISIGYNKDLNQIDLLSHEYMHRVEQNISKMNYEAESGAIMEAYSDIFGEIVEEKLENKSPDWIHNGIRNIIDPSKDKLPTVYQGEYWKDTDNLDRDNGYVHYNNTVISHAAYLMWNGIDGTDDKKIDIDTLAKIWYKALFLMHSNATFSQCANNVYKAANSVKGLTKEQLNCVAEAFEKVGIDIYYGDSIRAKKGTKLFVYDVNLEKYDNYHLTIQEIASIKKGNLVKNNSSDIVVDTDITNTDGYIFDLDLGIYELRIRDNEKSENSEDIVKRITVLPISFGIPNEVKVYTSFGQVNLSDFTIPDNITLTIGELNVIEPETIPIDATGYSLKWTSSDESVATVSPTGENGIITAKAKGEATITAELTSNGKTIIKTTNVRVASQGRDTVLVLDVSGSMSGMPIDEMKKSAIQFCNDLLKDEYNNRVGLVFYDNYIETVDLTNDLNTLVDYIESVNSGATTNMEGGLSAAGDMLNNQGKDGNIKNIVIMADGLPNVGAVSSSGSMPDTSYSSYNSSSEYASAVIDTANSLMKKYNLYSLGFFHSLYGEEKDFAVTLMKELTNMQDGYHQVDEAENLQFAFGDIQETISDGSKIVINIACPVDVNVTYNGETLSSAANTYSDKASFGTLQLLGANKDIKVLSLNPSIDYDIELIGTDTGTMDYSVNYIDDTENIIDYRSFESIPITATTVIDSNTNNAEEVTLSIDEDGDGVIDLIWSASPNSSATLTFGETQTEPEKIPEPDVSKDSDSWKIVLVSVIVVLVFIAVIMIVVFLVSSGKRKNNRIEIPIVNNPPKNNDSELDKKLPEISTRYAVVISTGSMSGTRFALDNEDTFCIGKGNEPSQINLSSDYSSVSRQHCMVTCNFEEDCYYVTDCSMNGTYFKNGKKLSKNVPTKVTHGTTMQLANSNCEVLFE